MKRIAIVTTHRANNFGAMLQAFSLVEMCNELGCDAEILDWRCPHFEELYHCNFKHTFSLRSAWYTFWKLCIERPTWRRFNDFRVKLRLSRPIKTRSLLLDAENYYDAFITGSDQVWNPVNSAPSTHLETFDRTYLLDFVRNKSKNAYAASIGVDEIRPAEILNEFIVAWKSFDVISIREHRGAEYVEQMSGHVAFPVVDPVLLHDADWWLRKASVEKEGVCGGVFEYNVNQIPELDRIARANADALHEDLIKPIVPAQAMFRNVIGKSLGPLEFVRAVHRASYVYTSSFHCAAFALIFRKRLFLARRTSVDRPNSRYESLFRYASVTPSVVHAESGLEILEVDFSKMNDDHFEGERKRSIEVLKSILK